MARLAYSQDQVDGKREDILDAAMLLFEHEGIDAVSFRRIAAALGWSYATPYRYFAGKAELVSGLRERTYRWMGQCLQAAIRPDSPPLAQLGDLAQAYIRAALERPTRYALLFDLSQQGSPSTELAQARHEAFDICTRVVRAAEQAGALKLNSDPLTAAHLFWAGAHGIVALQVAGQLEMGRNVEQLIPPMIKALIAGI